MSQRVPKYQKYPAYNSVEDSNINKIFLDRKKSADENSNERMFKGRPKEQYMK